MNLTFLGRFVGDVACSEDVGLAPVRQLDDDTLVAAVEMLRELELLYRVKADDDVPALEFVDMELLQLLEAIELALDANCPLRVLLGEMARCVCCKVIGERSSAAAINCCKDPLLLPMLSGDVFE